jgi:hypothetical protein
VTAQKQDQTMPHKHVNITVDCSSLPPIFTFSGNVDSGNSEIVDADGGKKDKIIWKVEGRNNPLGRVTFAATNPIVFAGGTEDPWAAGSQPTLTSKSDTKIEMLDDNTALHPTVLHHYYQINVVYNGITYNKDPEVDESLNTNPV